MEMSKNKTNEREDWPREFTQFEQQAQNQLKKMKLSFWDLGKMQALYHWSPRRGKRMGLRSVGRNVAKNSLAKRYKLTDLKRWANRITPPKKSILRHITIKFLKLKMKENMKAAKENTLPRRTSSQTTFDFSSKTMETRRKWRKEKNRQLRIPYPTKLSFWKEGEIKKFSKEN